MPDVIICANFGMENVRSVGYTGRGSKFWLFHWKGWSPLQQCFATAQPVI